jgi:tRNA1(Val) A37 N6-methylase TrmN6
LEKFNIGNITPILCDLKNLQYREFFTLITCNPPYKKIGAGIESVNEAERIARHEVACTIDDICKVSQKLLKNNGRLCLCNRSERLADVVAAMRENKIEPKRLQFISKNENTPPWLFLIEGKKNAKPFLQILPQIYMKDGLRFSD